MLNTNNKNNNVIFGVVIDNNDPTNSGRIRVLLDTQEGLGNQSFKKWQTTGDGLISDPYVCNPLLPKFFQSIPKINELVKVILVESDNGISDKLYIGPEIAQLQNINFTDSLLGRSFYNTSRTNLFKNLDYETTAKDIFPNKEDISILGRKNSDVIIKENEVLIRAGKFINEDINNYNNDLSQITITHFPLNIEETEKIENVIVDKTLIINNLIEYSVNIINNEFIGTLQVRKPEDIIYFKNQEKSDLNFDPENYSIISKILLEANFTGKTAFDINDIIIGLITDIQNKKIKSSFYSNNTQNVNITINQSFNALPFYFRPNQETRDLIIGNQVINDICRSIQIKDQILEGYITYNDELTEEKIVSVKNTKINNEYKNVISLNSGEVYITSNNDLIIPLETFRYGLNIEDLNNFLFKNTQPMVKGITLGKYLINIIDYLLTHIHTGGDASQQPYSFIDLNSIKENILKEINNDKINNKDNKNNIFLNSQIRIN